MAMRDKKLCPACQQEEKGEQECPHCGFPLGRFRARWLPGTEVDREFAELVQKHKALYEAQKGQRLFMGDVFLGIATSEEAEIWIDGQMVGRTRGKYLAVENLAAGQHLVEAKTPYAYGRAEVEVGAQDARRVEVKLERLKGDLRVLSEVGDVEVEVEGKRYRPPVVIRGLLAGRQEVMVYRGEALIAVTVEVRPGEVAELRLTEDQLPGVKWVRCHDSAVESVAFSPDGRRLASGSRDNTVRLWWVEDGRCLWQGKHDSWVNSVAFSPDGRLLASGSSDKTVRLWRVEDGRCLWQGKHDGAVLSVAFSPDGRLLASGSGSDDKTVRLWRVEDGRCLWQGKHDGAVWSVAFSPDGQLLASGSEDKTVRLWRVEDGRCLWQGKHDDKVYSVAFSPDGRLLASGSRDKTVRLWRVEDGRCLWQGKHDDAVLSVAFSPDGRLLASGSRDNTVRLWRVEDGRCLWQGKHDGAVLSVAFSPDGRLLALGSGDNTVRLWWVPVLAG